MCLFEKYEHENKTLHPVFKECKNNYREITCFVFVLLKTGARNNKILKYHLVSSLLTQKATLVHV